MPPSTRRLLIPIAILAVFVIATVVLIVKPGAAPACGANTVTVDRPFALANGATIALPAGSPDLRFDSLVLADADLTLDANAQALAAISAMPVTLRTEGSLLALTRCGETPVPIHFESPAPDASLDAYGWDGTRWSWLGGSTDRLSVDLPDLPKVVAWARALPTAPIIGTGTDPQTGGLAPEYNGLITELYAPGLSVAANGSVIGQVPPAPPAGSPYAVYPLISTVKPDNSFDTAAVNAMLVSAEARKTHVETLMSIANGSNFAGIAIDYQGLKLEADTSEAFGSLVDDLAAALHATGKQLVVRLPAPDAAGTTSYDWARIGRAADVVQLELPVTPYAYASQTDNIVLSIIGWVMQRVDRAKIQPIISADSDHDAFEGASLSFAEAASSFLPRASSPISATAGTPLTVSLGFITFDPALGVYAAGPRDGQTRIHTAAALAYKLNALSDLRLRGAVIRDVQGGDVTPNLLEPIRAYRQQSSVTGSSELNVDWSISNADGSYTFYQTRPLASADLVWTPDRDGTFTVKAAIASVSRDVAVVTVGAATAGDTGTSGGNAPVGGSCLGAAYVADVSVPDNTRFDKGKDFTKTWRVKNSGTCAWRAGTELAFVSGSQLGASSPAQVGALDAGKTVDISLPMKSGDKDGAFTGYWQLRDKNGAFGDPLSVVIKVGAEVAAPPPVAPPAAGGPIEYGIHAHYYGYLDGEAGAQNISDLTNELGLGWVKIQFRWGDYDYFCGGADLNVLGTMINRANASGLKVLLSIVTAPPCEHAWTQDVHAPPDDPNKMANTVGWLIDNFKGRIHGIEVWNEQNLSREWKTNPQTLDAARYTQLLAAVYNTVKAKDPNVLVISGALAPTGWNDGVNATDDFTYLQQMVAAGAPKYMDCVGTHVNALRVPPSAKLGGPYDSLFSPPHHSWYYYDTVIGYQSLTGKPACVTEFGVATQEGVGSVGGFEWAADNTQQEQADWVTEGMGLCKQWGCRLVILWNLDYGPATGQVNDNALYSFLDMGWNRRPVFSAVKNWCAANGCR